jgi:radical SAM superfamily enzyme YgiQ (UPF0313 family)
MLKKHGNEVEFLDGPVCNILPKDIIRKIVTFNPSLFICHTTTPSIYNDLGYCLQIKEILNDCLIVLVGSHASALPEATLNLAKEEFNDAVDAIAVGECEWTLTNLSRKTDSLKNIKGLASLNNKKLVFEPALPVPVDDLPFPSWEMIDPNDYRDLGKRCPFLTLIHARGCIGNCIFCRDTQINKTGKVRCRDVDLIVAEMEHDLSLYPQIKEIMFETDNFASNPEHTEKLCKAIISSGLYKRIPWSCNTRVDTPLELLPLMKEAGCRMLMTGFEFGTQKSLDAVNKGTTLEQANIFAHTASKLGFIIHGCFMIGAPGETEKDAIKTIEFAKSLPCDTVQFSGLCPYPGTPLYYQAIKNNWLLPKNWKEWVNKDYEQCTLLSYPEFPAHKIDYYIDKGLRQFYLRPKQIIKMLMNIGSLADFKRKLYGFTSFLDYFSKKS